MKLYREIKAFCPDFRPIRKLLKELGATDKDIKFWMGANLLTRWSDGMYYFTKKAELVVQRMLLAEEKTEELREMREWLD
ncbi:hypothetical protein IID22_04935 [Patescibacteria group bacterium]|nr:hypothetical protein [Patescibacteria group bacterium]